MGINRQSLKTILFENNYKKIHGNVLLIGRSTVTLAEENVKKLFENYLGSFPKFKKKETITKAAKQGGYFIDDKELFYAISNEIKKIDVLDVSKYEGANIEANLNVEVSKDLFGKYDFIYDSSVLDNVFNPSSFILNVSSMLNTGGRYVGYNGTNFFPGTMVAVHPEWFYSFFAVNKYRDCKVYLAHCRKEGSNRFEYETDLWLYRPEFTRNPNFNYFEAAKTTSGIFLTLVVAEKGDYEANFHNHKIPINLQYLESSNCENWASKEYHIFETKRPLMHGERFLDESEIAVPLHTDHFVYKGSGF